MTQLYRKESFLKDAKTYKSLYLDVNYPAHIRPSTRDVEWQIEPKYAERPDVLAHEIYGSSRYWWVFAARNPDVLKDPLKDFKSGVVIFLPAEESVLSTGEV
jgi:hypothetical protein